MLYFLDNKLNFETRSGVVCVRNFLINTEQEPFIGTVASVPQHGDVRLQTITPQASYMRQHWELSEPVNAILSDQRKTAALIFSILMIEPCQFEELHSSIGGIITSTETHQGTIVS